MPSKVKSGIETFTFLVDIVVYALETTILASRFIERNVLFFGFLQPLQRNGHTNGITLNKCFFTLHFNHLSKGILSVDAHNITHRNRTIGKFNGINGLISLDRLLWSLSLQLLNFFIVTLLLRFQSLDFSFHDFAGAIGLLFCCLGSFNITNRLFYSTVSICKYLSCLLTCLRNDVIFFTLKFIVELLILLYHLVKKIVAHFQFSALTGYFLLVKFYLLQLVFKIEHFVPHFCFGST